MFLGLRMAAYLLFGAIAGQGIEGFIFDEATGDVTFTFNVDSTIQLVLGGGGFIGTFGTSFLDRLRGPGERDA